MSEDDAASAAELAYQHKGHAAAVFKPMFGQAVRRESDVI